MSKDLHYPSGGGESRRKHDRLFPAPFIGQIARRNLKDKICRRKNYPGIKNLRKRQSAVNIKKRAYYIHDLYAKQALDPKHQDKIPL